MEIERLKESFGIACRTKCWGGKICLQMKANFILLYFFLVPKVSQVEETLNTPGYFKSRKKALSTQEPEAVPISWSHKYTSWTVSSIQASPTE